jgi:hypothetical protein
MRWRLATGCFSTPMPSTKLERLERALLEVRGQPARWVVEHVLKRVSALANGAPQSGNISCVAVIREPCLNRLRLAAVVAEYRHTLQPLSNNQQTANILSTTIHSET